MNFTEFLRENISVPVVILLGGKGRRMENLPYKSIVGKKQLLPIDFNEEGEPVLVFEPNFEILLELGFKEFYFLIDEKDKERVYNYFTKKFGEKTSVILASQNQKEKSEEKPTIYLVPLSNEGIIPFLLSLEEYFKSKEVFILLGGDVYFGIEKEKVKKELKRVVFEGIKKVKEGAVRFDVFVKKEKEILLNETSEINWFPINIDKDKKVITSSIEESLIITGFYIFSTEIFKIIKTLNPSSLNDPKLLNELLKRGVWYGEEADVYHENFNKDLHYRAVVKKLRERKTNKTKEF
jgi:NDP-sugar pyrophosphorylase family protein